MRGEQQLKITTWIEVFFNHLDLRLCLKCDFKLQCCCACEKRPLSIPVWRLRNLWWIELRSKSNSINMLTWCVSVFLHKYHLDNLCTTFGLRSAFFNRKISYAPDANCTLEEAKTIQTLLRVGTNANEKEFKVFSCFRFRKTTLIGIWMGSLMGSIHFDSTKTKLAAEISSCDKIN